MRPSAKWNPTIKHPILSTESSLLRDVHQSSLHSFAICRLPNCRITSSHQPENGSKVKTRSGNTSAFLQEQLNTPIPDTKCNIYETYNVPAQVRNTHGWNQTHFLWPRKHQTMQLLKHTFVDIFSSTLGRHITSYIVVMSAPN